MSNGYRKLASDPDFLSLINDIYEAAQDSIKLEIQNHSEEEGLIDDIMLGGELDDDVLADRKKREIIKLIEDYNPEPEYVKLTQERFQLLATRAIAEASKLSELVRTSNELGISLDENVRSILISELEVIISALKQPVVNKDYIENISDILKKYLKKSGENFITNELEGAFKILKNTLSEFLS